MGVDLPGNSPQPPGLESNGPNGLLDANLGAPAQFYTPGDRGAPGFRRR